MSIPKNFIKIRKLAIRRQPGSRTSVAFSPALERMAIGARAPAMPGVAEAAAKDAATMPWRASRTEPDRARQDYYNYYREYYI